MTEELVFQLREAGFKMPTLGGEKGWSVEGEVFKAPSLSELIEACGDKFDSLSRIESTGRWRASFSYTKLKAEYGDTPEEAVARLWLALNKKI